MADLPTRRLPDMTISQTLPAAESGSFKLDVLQSGESELGVDP
jgi:hypothetical protein